MFLVLYNTNHSSNTFSYHNKDIFRVLLFDKYDIPFDPHHSAPLKRQPTMPLSSNTLTRDNPRHTTKPHLPSGNQKSTKSCSLSGKNPPSRQTVIGSRIGKTTALRVVRQQRKDPAQDRTTRVFVNNRLGTKAEIICSSSDTVGDFKKLVAMKLGLKVEAIMLMRQGQRPLKDDISLMDYEIGSGSSLDLEMDTSD